MTANRIKEVALTHFAKKGYEGASLSHVAKEVGIKTPSIYAHFKGKKDLFLHVIPEVIEIELCFLNDYFNRTRHEPLQVRLYDLIMQYKERYEHSARVKFWMRMMFFPPIALQEPVMKYVYDYLDRLEELLTEVFSDCQTEIGQNNPNQAAVSFMCLLDGLLVEMLYGGSTRFEKRVKASWDIYWKGLANS
ncbi:TetR/AcrR family transcriptional regulator [Kroppenstedtia pulmonis]|uniref:TetR/AcrR family transcriptional regulator n=1 Tax=Kroppenstedtia pulmonis TaxID=1380685 RepID=A0A7D4B3D8_9BACL|nr:TetR/AcrR family transcriptional regulator [Kroppenstedtia pulmonis]QKG85246.1 TetR/AcrR family transcriptional regulator [Kroppenstedtia pulmonis]